MRLILDGVTLVPVYQAKVHDLAIVEGDHHLEQEVCVTAGHALVQIHVTDLAEAQKEDPMVSTVLNWLKAQRKTDLKALLAEHTSSEEGRLILWNLQNFGNPSRGLVPMLNAQRWDQRSFILCGAQGPSCHHLEWVPQGCGSSGMQPYPDFVMGAFLVARHDQLDVAVYYILHMVLAT